MRLTFAYTTRDWRENVWQNKAANSWVIRVIFWFSTVQLETWKNVSKRQIGRFHRAQNWIREVVKQDWVEFPVLGWLQFRTPQEEVSKIESFIALLIFFIKRVPHNLPFGPQTLHWGYITSFWDKCYRILLTDPMLIVTQRAQNVRWRNHAIKFRKCRISFSFCVSQFRTFIFETVHGYRTISWSYI